MHLLEHKAASFLQARMLRIFMNFLSVVTIVQKPKSGDQMREKGTLLTVFVCSDCVRVFKFNNNLIEGTRTQTSSGSKEINLTFF